MSSNRSTEQEVGLDGSPIPDVPADVVVPYRMSTPGSDTRGIRWFMPYAARISVLEELYL